MIILDIKKEITKPGDLTNGGDNPGSRDIEVVLKMYLGRETVTELVRGVTVSPTGDDTIDLVDLLTSLNTKQGYNFEGCIISFFDYTEKMYIYCGTMPLNGPCMIPLQDG